MKVDYIKFDLYNDYIKVVYLLPINKIKNPYTVGYKNIICSHVGIYKTNGLTCFSNINNKTRFEMGNNISI